MAPRWNWDFDDEHRPGRRAQAPPQPVPAGPPPGPAAPPPPAARTARAVLVRRRRLALALAALLLAGVLAAAAALVAGPGGTTAASTGHRALVAGHGGGAPPPSEEQALRASVSSVLAYTPFVRQGTTSKPEVALTFDDGPGPYTPQILSVLERFHAHATFFAIGRMERWFATSTQREIADGDVVGDHTETHPMLAQLSPRDQREQLVEQIERVELAGAPRPNLFRPPYGSFDAATMRLLHSLHLLMVLWSADTGDYQQPGVEAIVQRALAGAHPGAIILMHDGGGTRAQTVAALPAILAGLRARGLHPVTVPQLLRDDPPSPGQPLPRSLAGD
jgi:peptidoglycan-N-acetylglucosamine deacetylase